MSVISEAEFERIVAGIIEDRETIVKHNPLGTEAEILLWMLMSCLVAYLSLDELETPCFTGRPDVKVYRDAIEFILKGRMTDEFDPSHYLDRLIAPNASI
jgi:hypothetical protein